MTIEQRVAKLERQNRWMKRAGGVMLAAVACVFLMGQGKADKPGPVEATAFVLRDADGKNRGELGITDSGLCRLVLRDSQGHDMVCLSVNEEGTIAALGLRDKRGTNRVELVGAVEAAGLNLNDIRGDTRIRLYASPNDKQESRLVLFGPRRHARAVVSVDPGGSGRVKLKDKSGKLVWKAP